MLKNQILKQPRGLKTSYLNPILSVCFCFHFLLRYPFYSFLIIYAMTTGAVKFLTDISSLSCCRSVIMILLLKGYFYNLFFFIKMCIRFSVFENCFQKVKRSFICGSLLFKFVYVV